MVKFVDALPTTAAMRHPRKFVIIAYFTLLLSCSVGIIEEFTIFLLKEGRSPKSRHIIFDSHGLKIAPKTHKNIEIGEKTHVECFAIVENASEDLTMMTHTCVSR